MASDSVPFSKKGERKISGFVGQELLFDYVTSNLDPERAAAVEEYVKSSREAQTDIQKINDGLSYVEELSEIHVSEALLENFKLPSSYMQVLLRKVHFDDWSPGIKMGLEVIVVAVGVISLTLVLPWHKLMEINWGGSREVVLAEVQKSPISKEDVEVAGSPEENTVVFPDESEKAKPPVKEKPTAPPVQAEAEKAKPIENKLVAAAPSNVAPTPTSEKPKAAAKAKEESTTEKRQGFLYRGTLVVTNAPAVAAKFADKITELGGRKGGEVELGWKKGESNYFHFTMPEAKYQSLIDFSQEYGGLVLAKEKHDRVMPEGIVRIIFIIEEKK